MCDGRGCVTIAAHGSLVEQRPRRPRGDSRHRPLGARAVGCRDANAARPRADRSARQRRSHERAAPLLPRWTGATEPQHRRARSRGSAIDVLTHPALARLHPTFGHPEAPERIGVLLDAFPDAREGRPASHAAIERVHTPAYLDTLARITEPTW